VKFAILFVFASVVHAHDIITTPITWSREISRIVLKKCAGCHTQKGSAFPLTTYKEVRPWVVAIREEVLHRTMPPWGAVKGFGEFSNDTSLTPEEIELIVNWSEGGVPEGEEKDLPKDVGVPAMPRIASQNRIALTGTLKLQRPFKLGALVPKKTIPNASFQITAELPDGTIEPLLWLKDYRDRYAHPFVLRAPLLLPQGTTIRGVPPGNIMMFAPAHK
jgi:hypothetical protein